MGGLSLPQRKLQMIISESDEALIQAYLLHPANHYREALYRRYVQKVYRRCLSMTKDPMLAQDFTQDIFLKVFTRLADVQHRSRFSSWLYTITYHYCLDQLQLAKRLPLLPLLDQAVFQQADRLEDPDCSEAATLADQALAQLSAQEQGLLRLKYEQAWSLEQIAGQEDLSVGAVKMRLRRIRAKVQRLSRRD